MSGSNTSEALKLLIGERDRLDGAITTLQGAAKVEPVATAEAPKKRGRRPRTAAQKKAHSERMKEYWAKRRKAAK